MAHQLEEEIDYRFKNETHLINALTHKSYSHENKENIEHNERMEFLGDAILDLVITEHLYESLSEKREGELSRIRAAMVNETTLAAIARKINLGEFILLGKGEVKTGGRDKNSILSDTIEAVIAAVYLDGGIDAAKKVISKFVLSHVKEFELVERRFDFKTRLQEFSQKQWRKIPQYEVASEDGPDHAKVFRVNVKVGDKIFEGALGKSKKDAEQNAARLFMENENL
jgi:ribonuclease III